MEHKVKMESKINTTRRSRHASKQTKAKLFNYRTDLLCFIFVDLFSFVHLILVALPLTTLFIV